MSQLSQCSHCSFLPILSVSYVHHSVGPCDSFQPGSNIAPFLKKTGTKGFGQGDGAGAPWGWLARAMLIQNLQKRKVEDAGRQEGISAFVLPRSSLPAWSVTQEVNPEALLRDDLPIAHPTHSPAHSCGCSLVTQPRWLCPDSSAPASSRWITQWFPLPTLVCQLHHLKNEEGTWAGVYVKDREQRNVLLSLTYTNISL